MEQFRTDIVRLLGKQVGGKGKLSSEEINTLLEIPGDSKYGDLAFPCFTLAKPQKIAPQLFAENLVQMLKPGGSVLKIEVKGGYVNFFAEPRILIEQVLRQIFSEKDAFGAKNLGKNKKLVIEFSSPNIAKPFGIGHLRSTIIGNALANVFRFLNYNVIAMNHLGDWGTQFGKILCAYKKWGTADFLKGDPIINLYNLYVKFHQEEENDPQLANEGRAWFHKLETGDKEATELWEWFREITMTELKSIYSSFHIHFDYQLGESFYTDKMPATLEHLRQKGLLEESEGAQIVRLEPLKIPPALIMKKDESTLYITRDLAAAEYRYNTFHPERMLYVVGTPQALHFQQLFAVLKKMDYQWADTLSHIDFGHLSFKDGGGMSTRQGKMVFLKDVLDKAVEMSLQIISEKNAELPNKQKVATQVAIGALIYADFSAKRKKDVKFDWDEILNFEGETGPYLQYSSVRMRSLLGKFKGSVTDNIDFAQLNQPVVFELVKELGAFGGRLIEASEEKEPFILATYLMGVAKRYNKFYNQERILDQDGETSLARIFLTWCTSNVLDTGLGLLGIPLPERM